MNRISERELQEIGRLGFDPAPELCETAAQALVASVYRLSYLFKLWGAVAIAYVVARALIG